MLKSFVLELKLPEGSDPLSFVVAAVPALATGKLRACGRLPIVPVTALGEALTFMPGPASALPSIRADPLKLIFPLLAMVPLFCGELRYEVAPLAALHINH